MPMRLTTIDHAQEYLLGFSDPKPSGDTYTPERMRELMKLLGNPQDSFMSVHVAGTSGKTSTAYFIRAMLRKASRKVGLTASPHVTSITERVQVGDGPVSDDVFLRYLNEFLELIAKWPNVRPTYFELLTAFAYYVFSQEKVDYAVVEVGLGGLLDATNVIGRGDKVSVITPIGLDHTQILGRTIDEIASQKAGIILSGTQVFMAHQTEAAERVVSEVCEARRASLTIVRQTEQVDSLPPFQQVNLSVARAVFDYLGERDGLPRLDESDVRSVQRQVPPGRFESHTVGGKTIMLDGAHNPQKLTAFIEAYGKRAKADTIWVVALLDGPEQKLKDCIDIIMQQPGRVIVTEFEIGNGAKARRSITAGRFINLAGEYGKEIIAEANPVNALTLALSGPGSEVVVTGSLYLVGILRKRLV